MAALAHPNILVLYDVGEHEGIHYAVTELLEGETLRDCLSRGPLDWRIAVEFAIGTAEGLAAAQSSVSTADMVSAAEFREKGRIPATISYSTTPSEKMSLGAPVFSPLQLSRQTCRGVARLCTLAIHRMKFAQWGRHSARSGLQPGAIR